MSNVRRVRIAGLGRFLPERVVTSAEIERDYDLPENWIIPKTGIQERRWVTDERAPDMGAKAAIEACQAAGIEPKDVDLIINASGTPAQGIPDGAHLIQRELGLSDSGIPCFTVHNTCLSFITGMDVAASFIESGRYKTILIVTADIASRGFDRDDPKSFSLFGDAAAAAVVVPAEEGQDSCIMETRFESYSSGAEFAKIEGWGTTNPADSPETTHKQNTFQMDGVEIFMVARELMPKYMERLKEGFSKGHPDMGLIVPHQPSLLALRGMKYAGIKEEDVVITLDRYGNCVAASVPLTLYEAVHTGRLKRGDNFLMVGLGAGLCMGGMRVVY